MIIGTPPQASTLPRTSRLFVSMFLPRSISPPGWTSSPPVGMKATLGLVRTATEVMFPEAILAATSGVILSPTLARTSPRLMLAPAGLVPANRLEGAASISTCCSSSDTLTCSMTIAVSNPSGMATPVFANSQSLPRTQTEVSGISPSAKPSQCTAMESIMHCRVFGESTLDTTSRASTLPKLRSTSTTSSSGPCSQFGNPHLARTASTASSRVISI